MFRRLFRGVAVLVLPLAISVASTSAAQSTLDVVKKPTSLAGEPMSGQIELAFSTPRPKLVSTDPSANEERWSITAPLQVELSQEIAEERLRAGLSLVKSDGTVVPTRYERHDAQKSAEHRGQLVPLAPLEEGQRYELRLAAGVVVTVVALLALGLSFLATLYPAWRAAHVRIVDGLRSVGVMLGLDPHRIGAEARS